MTPLISTTEVPTEVQSIETDLQIQSRLTVPGTVGRVEGSSKKGRKKKLMDNSVVIVGRRV